MAKDRIGNYELVSLIGDGAQGKVFKARCLGGAPDSLPADTIVAMKVLRVTADNERTHARFNSQAQILKRLNHPNIVRYADSFIWHPGEWDEAMCLVMEFLEGETLDDRLKKQPRGLPWPEVKHIFDQVFGALIYAQHRGIVHRDLKPSNIFLTRNGTVKIFDFDVARNEQDSQASTVGWKGTFDYMAPDFVHTDSFRGDEISDVFSLGTCIYQAMTGKLPYEPLGESAHIGYLNRWRTTSKPAEPSFRPGVFRVLAHSKSFISKALHPQREERFPGFAPMYESFQRIHYRTIEHKDKDVYELHEVLGRGGFGEVFRGVRRSDGKAVAIKHLFAERQSDRFIKEARILQQYSHPALVEYIDFVAVKGATNESQYFLILELLEGMPEAGLRFRIKQEGRLDPEECLLIFIKYLDALAFLHENPKPIIHRDIKPTNLYAPKGHPEEAKIFDLGVARDVTGTATVGGVPGTLDYMAPEMATSATDRGSPQSDIYAMGLCLYESLTGKPAFPRLPADMNAAWVEFQQRAQVKEFDFNDAVFNKYPALRPVVEKSLSPDPKKRYARASEMKRDLEKIVDSIRSRGQHLTTTFFDSRTLATMAPRTVSPTLAPTVPPHPESTGPARPPSSAAQPPSAASRTRDDKTVAVHPATQRRLGRLVLLARLLALLIILGGLGAGGYFGWPFLRPLLDRQLARFRGGPPAGADVGGEAPTAERVTPDVAYVRDLNGRMNQALNQLGLNPDDRELRTRVNALRVSAAAIPAAFTNAQELAIQDGNRAETERLLNDWRALSEYQMLMGITTDAFDQVAGSLQDGLEFLDFAARVDQLLKLVPTKFTGDAAGFAAMEQLLRQYQQLVTQTTAGRDDAARQRRRARLQKVADAIKAAFAGYIGDLRNLAVIKINSGYTGDPEYGALTNLPARAPGLVSLAQAEYDEALATMAQARQARTTQKRTALLAQVAAARTPSDLNPPVTALEKWPAEPIQPSAEDLKLVSDAIRAKYAEMARLIFERARDEYAANRLAEGDSLRQALQTLVGMVPETYGRRELGGFVNEADTLRTAADTRIKDAAARQAAELAAQRKAEEERKAAELAAQQQAEAERKAAELAAQQRAEEERQAAAVAAMQKAAAERRAAEAAAQQQAEEERKAAALEAQRKVEAEAKAKADEEARLKAEKEKAEREAQARAAEEARLKAEKAKAEQEARAKAEQEVRLKAEKEKAEREAQARAAEEARLKAEKEKAEKEKAEQAALQKAEREAKAKAEKEKADQESRRQAEAAALAAAAPGELEIAVTPREARVFVDDQPLTEATIKVTPGVNHKVRIELEGYETYEQYHRVKSGESKYIDVPLIKVKKKGGFWF